jgi:hypothetical protein
MHEDIREAQILAEPVRDFVADPVGILQREIARHLHVEIGMPALGAASRPNLVHADHAVHSKSDRLDL